MKLYKILLNSRVYFDYIETTIFSDFNILNSHRLEICRSRISAVPLSFIRLAGFAGNSFTSQRLKLKQSYDNSA